MSFVYQVSGVYSLIHRRSGKEYIGSSMNVISRIAQHQTDLKGGYHSNTDFQNEFNKDRYCVIDCRILELVEDKERLRVREYYWMQQRESHLKGFNTPKELYNLKAYSQRFETPYFEIDLPEPTIIVPYVPRVSPCCPERWRV